MPEVGIVLTLRERVTNTMKAMADSGKALSKDFDDLLDRVTATEEQQTALAKGIAKTKTEIAKQSDTVKASKKAWDELRKTKGASQDDINAAANAYQQEAEALEGLRDRLNEYNAASRDARAEMRGMSTEYRKMKQEMETGGKSPTATGSTPGQSSDVFGKLRDVGLTKMLGDSVSQIAGSFLESATGQPAASAISSLVSGAATGFALGGLPGAAVGAVAGGINGAAQFFNAKDDAFKSYYQDAAQNVQEEQQSMISAGSTVASGREQTQMAFAQRLGGDQEAKNFLQEVKAMAGKTNYSYDEITGYSKGLLNSYNTDEIFGVLKSLSDATAGLNLSSGDVSMMISGLGRMRTTGKATQEYLNYFSERGVDVYQALSNSTGADKSQIAEMVTKGEIGGADAAAAILDYINETFGGLSEKLAGTYDAMVDNLADAEANLQEYAGQGFNEERKKGIEAQQKWMEESESGLGEAYSAIGAWKASLENSKEQFIRDAMDAMMESEEYQTAEAEGNAAEMGRLLMQAKVHGMNEYNASEGAQLALESELALADGIREDTSSNAAYYDAGYRKGQEYSKGLVDGMIPDNLAEVDEKTIQQVSKWDAMNYYDPSLTGVKGRATGLDRVPYDNFPALLHEGERVLTAQEARSQDRSSGGVVVNMGEVVIREDADIDRIAEAIAEKIRLARMAG